jgi:protoheme IX farnesyltransferase
MALVAVGAGWLLAADADTNPDSLVRALIGVALLFAGASGLNQFAERDSDALMLRTANRPLPARKLRPWIVFVVGSALCVGGLADLLAAHQRLAAALGAFALFMYVLVYTPLKRWTTLNTLIGAVPGAVPPLMGWAAARGRLDAGALALFLIVFLWQIPHFLAIAWIYRDEYARAGLCMLPVFDSDGGQTGRQMIRYVVALIFASLLPLTLGQSGWLAGIGAVVLGLFFLSKVLVFAQAPTTSNARQVFHMSLLFLPALLLFLVLDATRLTGG